MGTGAGAGVDFAWEQEELEAKSLSKYDLYTLNPFPNFSVVFGEGVRRMGGASARFVGRFVAPDSLT
jgi:hypothetical protein